MKVISFILTLSLVIAKFHVGVSPLQCDPELPNLSIGDVNLTNKNFMKFKKSSKAFVLAISDSQCPDCC